jgi:UDP-N-acetyl-D-galactosamine dehydrogenase
MTVAPHIVIIGLGYVGLPLAVALARKFDVMGFDIDAERLAELREGRDRTREIEADALRKSSLKLTSQPEDCAGASVYIVTVPTPVDKSNSPDLSAVLAATRTIASVMDPVQRPTIVYESTVYSGVTEDVCGPEIERLSGLKRQSWDERLRGGRVEGPLSQALRHRAL